GGGSPVARQGPLRALPPPPADVRAERELRAARAAAAGASAPPACAHNGSLGERAPSATPGGEQDGNGSQGAGTCARRWQQRDPGSPNGTRGLSPVDIRDLHTLLKAPVVSTGQWLQRLSIGWKYHDGKIYYFSSDRKPWKDAEDFCVSKKSHLVSVTSAAEQVGAAEGFYWIGLTDIEQEGVWRWVDGTKYRQDTSFWAPGQPDNTDYGPSGREECAQIHPVGRGLWNDHNCNVSFPWICKRRLDVNGI
uniref:C-type lectin domain-containing protein n=1 Tax=Nothoprocta perdicaria TaxID=30464 RepID=A0A8C6ZDX8_NOTPE